MRLYFHIIIINIGARLYTSAVYTSLLGVGYCIYRSLSEGGVSKQTNDGNKIDWPHLDFVYVTLCWHYR
jgi:hypothetical protein